MCGITYAKTKEAQLKALSLYEKQKERGQEGFGFVSLTDNKVSKYTRKQTEKGIKTELLLELKAEEVLFHHRYPTSAINLPETAHPIKVDWGDSVFYVVHNGVISNSDELKAKHQNKGIRYSTEVTEKTTYEVGGTTYQTTESKTYNDSESLAWELALVLTGTKQTIDTRGPIAFIALETDLEGNKKALHYGRNSGNPLTRQRTGGDLLLASEGLAETIATNTLYTERGGIEEKKPLKIGDYVDYSKNYSSSGLGKYWKDSSWNNPRKYQGEEDVEYNKVQEIEDRLDELEELKLEAELTGDWSEVDDLRREKVRLEADLESLYYGYH